MLVGLIHVPFLAITCEEWRRDPMQLPEQYHFGFF